MRVLIITDTYLRKSHVGGGDVIAQNIKNGLESLSHTVSVACCFGDDYEELNSDGIYRIFTPNYILKKLNPFKMFVNLIKERKKFNQIIKIYKPDLFRSLKTILTL